MSFPIKPLSEYVVTQADKKPTTTASGIYLTESAAEKSDVRIVKAVADDVKTIKVGDRVICKSYAGTEVKVGGEDYSLIKSEDILAILNEK